MRATRVYEICHGLSVSKIFTYFAMIVTVFLIRRFFVYSVGTTSLNKLKIIHSPEFLTVEIALDGVTVFVIRRFFVYSVGTTSLNKLKIIRSPVFLTVEIALDGDLPFER
jgi:hypothetical protein